MVGKQRKTIFSLITLGISVIIVVIIAEILVRFLQLEDRLQEVHFARNSRGQIVDADPVSEGCRFKVSSNRDLVYEPTSPPVLPEKKQPDELRILCLGDSIIDNIWRKTPVTFPVLLSNKFNKNPISPWKTCTVINAGVTGYNPVLEYEWYKQQWQAGQFDIVILCYCCANDRSENRQIVRKPGGTEDDLFCYNVREYIPYILDFPGHRFLLESSALFRLINSRLAPYLENWGIKIKELDLDRVPTIRNAILDLRDLCERNGSRFLLVIVPLLRPEEREYRWIMDLVQSAGLVCIDLRSTFKGTGYTKYVSKKNDGSTDYTHPNQLGHTVITDLIYRRLRGLAGIPRGENLLDDLEVRLTVGAYWFQPDQESLSRLIDNDPETTWSVSAGKKLFPVWVTVDLGEGRRKAVQALSVLTAEDRLGQFFREAKLFGSRDGAEWEQIAAIDQTAVPPAGEWIEWSFFNDRAFRYYKLLVMRGTSEGNTTLSISDLAMYE